MADQESDKNIEIWKIKLIKGLETTRGNGTSMISLIMPPRDQVARVTKMLADEYGTAPNIKSRVNHQSVLSAITLTQQRLKLYNKVPPNGLVLYTGTIITDDGKKKKVVFILARRIFSNYSFSFSNRLLSTAHATIAVSLATLSIQNWSCPVCSRASKPSRKQVLFHHI